MSKKSIIFIVLILTTSIIAGEGWYKEKKFKSSITLNFKAVPTCAANSKLKVTPTVVVVGENFQLTAGATIYPAKNKQKYEFYSPLNIPLTLAIIPQEFKCNNTTYTYGAKGATYYTLDSAHPHKAFNVEATESSSSYKNIFEVK